MRKEKRVLQALVHIGGKNVISFIMKIKAEKREKRGESAAERTRGLRRFYSLSSVLIICMLFALTLVSAGVGAGAGVLAVAGSGAVYGGRTDTGEVAIEINVYQGGEYVLEMLKTLEEFGAKATFFIGGCWADDNNEILLKILSSGNEIGNHGYFHKDGDKLDFEGNLREIRATNALIEAITGVRPSLFAPPSGAFGSDTLAAAEREGMKVVMWSKDTIDWRDKDEQLVIKRATKDVKAGDFILMHPTEHSARALPEILKAFAEKGLKAVRVSDLLPTDEKV